MHRDLTEKEKRLLVAMAARLNDEQKLQVLRDLENCKVKESNAEGSRIEFVIENYQRPPYHGQHDYGVGGAMKDMDGSEISVSLYADENDRVLELEFVKWSDDLSINQDWDTFNIQY